MSLHDRAVDHIQTVARFRCQRVENPLPDAAPRPTIEAIVRGRVGPIAFRQVTPRHASAQHVEYRIHDPAVVGTSALSALRHQRLQQSPFLVAQIKSHDPPPSTVNHVRRYFSMDYLGTDPKVLGSYVIVSALLRQMDQTVPHSWYQKLERNPSRGDFLCSIKEGRARL